MGVIIINDAKYGIIGVAKCNCSKCNEEGKYTLNADEVKNYMNYITKGPAAGTMEELFPNIPAWIRTGAINKFTDGKCLCPKCAKLTRS